MKNQRIESYLNLHRAVLFLLFLFLIPSNFSAQENEKSVVPLPIGTNIERTIKSKELHLFSINLKQNEFLRIDVIEKGADVRVGLFRIADEQIITDSEFGSVYDRELLTCLVEKTGDYLIVVEEKESNLSGRYELIASLKKTATKRDKDLIRGGKLLFEGLRMRGTPEEVIGKWKEALQIWAELDEKYWTGLTGNLIGLQYYLAGEKQKALEQFNFALSTFKNIGHESGEFKVLSNIGLVYNNSGENLKALEYYIQALPITKVLNYKFAEGVTLNNIGLSYEFLGERQKALYSLDQALRINREIKNQIEEAATLNNIGGVYSSLGNTRNALKFYDEALKLSKLTGNKLGEATTLNNIGTFLNDSGEEQKALNYYNQSLLIKKQLNDENGEAVTLINIGKLYKKLGESQKALTYLNQALSPIKSIKNKSVEAMTLNAIGLIYSSLGDQQIALKYFNEARSTLKQIQNIETEAVTYNNIGLSYHLAGNVNEALEFYNRALFLRERIGDAKGKILTLNNIGQAYGLSGNIEKTIEYLDKALKLSEQTQDKNGQVTILNNIGVAYRWSGKNREASQYYKKALLLSKQIDDKQLEATILSNMMDIWSLFDNQRLAIFLGQLAVDKYQQIRGSARSSDIDTGVQKSFLGSVRNHYKYLTELMVKQDLLEKAIQLLIIYQDEQFFDFNRNADSPVRQISLSFREKQLADLYENSGKEIYNINSQITELDWRLPSLDSFKQERKNPESLKIKFKSATDNLLSALEKAKTEFAQKPDEKDKVSTISDVTEMQSVLRQLNYSMKQETAVLYTLIGEKKFYIFLVTAKGDVKVFESPIDKQEFNWKLIQFYALLQRPAYDPRILGEELYKTIIPQKLEEELKKQKIQTLMWQLDGNLRYIPVAALWDGEKYLVEKYQNVVLTRADLQRLLKEVKPDWTGTGFGSSEAQQVDSSLKDGRKISFPGLPAIRKELTNIFLTDDNEKGILKGEVYINKDFTKKRFYEEMEKRRQVVHISSHFRFYPGDSSLSFLVLGDGKALTLTEMKDHRNLFEGVELLTLSACETGAVLPNADGREIDGFAELAQRLGADAVMASLWRAREYGTADLMAEFYSNRQKKNLNKAESLRLAQLSLIRGNDKSTAQTDTEKPLPANAAGGNSKGDNDPTDNAYSIDKIVVEDKYLKAFETDKRTNPYAHPYHWAPFVLFGNWK